MTISSTYATLQTSLTARARVGEVTAQVDRAADELASGFRTDIYEDLGMRGGQALQLRTRMAQADNFITTNEVLAGKLRMQEESLGQARAAIEDFLALSVQAGGDGNQFAAELQQQARTTLDLVRSSLNTSYAGEYLFSGIASDTPPLQARGEVNPGSGLSPEGAMAALTGGTIGAPADAAAKIADVDAAFDGTPGVPGHAFEATFYNGTPLTDAFGAPNPRVTARIDETETLSYGAQANDPAIRAAIKGLMMYASVDVSEIGDGAAYGAWVGAANDALADGLGGLDDMRVSVGNDIRVLSERIETQKDRASIYNEGILALEAVDPYEAATVVQSKKALLEATYAATAQIARLSFVNFL